MSEPDKLFTLVEELGVGTYGRVFSASPKNPKNFAGQDLVAMKIISFSEDIRTLKHEVDIMKDCKSNFIVKFFDSYESEAVHGNTLWIAMELCEPGSISDVMKITRQTLSEAQIRVISASVGLGLSYLHGRNVIHRDIKAGNILLTRNGTAKIADFGVSARMSTMNPFQHTTIGAPYWMAPEVIDSLADYDGKADIWSLGISVIEMAEGKPPHHEFPPMRVIFFIPSKAAPTLHAPAKYSTDMNDFLAKCVAKNPTARASASEVCLHAFVAKSAKDLVASGGGSPILLELANKCFPLMDEFKKNRDGTDNSLQKSSSFNEGSFVKN